MAKRAREGEDDVHLNDLMAVIAGPNDALGSEEDDLKEQLLKDGNAEAAWHLFLEEEQAKFWQAVQAEVRAALADVHVKEGCTAPPCAQCSVSALHLLCMRRRTRTKGPAPARTCRLRGSSV